MKKLASPTQEPALTPPDPEHDRGTAQEADEADRNREPERHRIGPGQRKARQRAGDEREEQRADHVPEQHPRSVARRHEGA